MSEEPVPRVLFINPVMQRPKHIDPPPINQTTALMLGAWCAKHDFHCIVSREADNEYSANIDLRDGVTVSGWGTTPELAATNAVMGILTTCERIQDIHESKYVRAHARLCALLTLRAIARGRLGLGEQRWE